MFEIIVSTVGLSFVVCGFVFFVRAILAWTAGVGDAEADRNAMNRYGVFSVQGSSYGRVLNWVYEHGYSSYQRSAARKTTRRVSS